MFTVEVSGDLAARQRKLENGSARYSSEAKAIVEKLSKEHDVETRTSPPSVSQRESNPPNPRRRGLRILSCLAWSEATIGPTGLPVHIKSHSDDM
jgi:hypothetical protein